MTEWPYMHMYPWLISTFISIVYTPACAYIQSIYQYNGVICFSLIAAYINVVYSFGSLKGHTYIERSKYTSLYQLSCLLLVGCLRAHVRSYNIIQVLSLYLWSVIVWPIYNTSIASFGPHFHHNQAVCLNLIDLDQIFKNTYN